MKKLIAAVALSFAFASPLVAAEEKEASKEEAEKVRAAIAQIGCEAPGEIEKEDSGIFEIDDAKCKIGQYDIKVDKDYKIKSLTSD